MDHELEQRPTQHAPAPEHHAEQQAAEESVVRARVGAVVAPLPVAATGGTLTVGHAEDRAEADADAHADRALSNLAKLTGETHQHGPGCDHVRRAVAIPSGEPVVGHEGGELDTGTSAAINARRGSGAQMETGVLQRMETAFGTDLSGVRLHTDSSAARLNHAVSARAFTTGQDIFFGAGEYAPDTPGGAKVLAHEIAHTLQPASGMRRTGVSVKQRAAAVEARVAAQQEAAAGGGHIALDEVPRVSVDGMRSLTPRDHEMFALIAVREASALSDLQVGVRTLLGILFGACHGDWNVAKELLVFKAWPGVAPITAEQAMTVMKALTVVRGYVHGRIQESLGYTKEQMEFKGSVGADSVTSDVDVSTGGTATEDGVAQYNLTFRTLLNTSFDPGTVFDLNVYAKDFVHGFDTTTIGNTTTLTPKEEVGAARLDAAGQKKRDDQQAAWSLTHVSRFLDAKDWDAFVENALHTSQDPEGERKVYLRARLNSILFETQIEMRSKELKAADGALDATVPGEAPGGVVGGALRMRAANSLYEQTLKKVRDLRQEISVLVAATAPPTQPASLAPTVAPEADAPQAGPAAGPLSAPSQARLNSLSLRLLEQTSLASLYANEVYGSGDAVLHAVIGTQIGAKMQTKARDVPGNEAASVSLNLTPAQWLNAFVDNAGDVLKDYEHLATSHDGSTPRYWWAAFKMGKYVNRMLGALDNYEVSLEDADRQDLQDSPLRKQLAELAAHHVEQKAGPAGNDPNLLATHPYFSTMTQETVTVLKDATLHLLVQTRAAQRRPLTQPAAGQ